MLLRGLTSAMATGLLCGVFWAAAAAHLALAEALPHADEGRDVTVTVSED